MVSSLFPDKRGGVRYLLQGIVSIQTSVPPEVTIVQGINRYYP